LECSLFIHSFGGCSSEEKKVENISYKKTRKEKLIPVYGLNFNRIVDCVKIIDDQMIMSVMAVEEYTSYGWMYRWKFGQATVVKWCLAGWHICRQNMWDNIKHLIINLKTLLWIIQ